ncbi:unnamed protein product [Polarella glacialis]|uniref:Subtilisin n=1 Tax=Polarella glacialis TaxID=89957 RepID=A0A813G827_POLGL|nr:unnamed protein product [Polarella glacialis]
MLLLLLLQLRGPSEITGSHQADSGTSAEFVGLGGPSEITDGHQADSGNSAEFVGLSGPSEITDSHPADSGNSVFCSLPCLPAACAVFECVAWAVQHQRF